MTEIWSDLEDTLMPMWMTSVPYNLGNPAHSKLKADQWCTLGTVYLQLSLIRLWGDIDTDNPHSVWCQKILEVMMSLVSAVVIATSYTISASHANTYLGHMVNYISGIKQLFPEYKLYPNHHMAWIPSIIWSSPFLVDIPLWADDWGNVCHITIKWVSWQLVVPVWSMELTFYVHQGNLKNLSLVLTHNQQIFVRYYWKAGVLML